MSRTRTLPRPAVLAGVDLDAHRERALRALVLHFGSDLKASPAEWEDKARAVLAQMEIYGLVPVHLGDPAFGKSRLLACEAFRRIHGLSPEPRCLLCGLGQCLERESMA